MSQNIDDLLDLALTEIEKGRSIEDYLKEHPELGAEVEPILRIALSIKDLPKPEPGSEAIEAAVLKGRQMLLEGGIEWEEFFLEKVIFLPAGVGSNCRGNFIGHISRMVEYRHK